MSTGTLYLVATPIGNSSDISARAIAILKHVDLIAAEDTRHSAPLLKQLGIHKPLKALHDHNERHSLNWFTEHLQQGQNLALISDAGTPLIADPGYHVVQHLKALNFPVIPIPGPCALITALSASGLPTDRFCFEGFLPAKSGARLKQLTALAQETRTLVFYESPHRILDSLQNMQEVFGAERHACLARELTKQFETIKAAPLSELLTFVSQDANQQRGEFVVIIAGADKIKKQELTEEEQQLLGLLRAHLPLKTASQVLAEYTGKSKKLFYDYGIQHD